MDEGASGIEIAGSNQEDQHPVERASQIEAIPTERLLHSAQRYQKFFGFPESYLDRLRTTTAYSATREQMVDRYVTSTRQQIEKIDEFCNSASSLLPKDKEELVAEKKRLEKEIEEGRFLEEIDSTHGQFIIDRDGRRTIVIKKNLGDEEQEVIDHEVLHALSTENTHSQGLSWIMGDSEEFGLLNEAGTELLRVAEQNPGLNVLELYGKHQSGELNIVAYGDQVRILLTLLALAHVNQVPLSMKDVAEYYFGTGQPGEGPRGLLGDLIPKLIGARGDKESERDAEKMINRLR